MADDLNPPLFPLASRVLARASGSFAVPKFVAQNVPALWGNMRRRPGWLASVALLAGSLVWLGWPSVEPAEALVVHRSGPPPLPVLVATAPAPALPAPIVLEDGSTIQLHTLDAALRTQHESEERVRLRLSGGAHFDVAPEPAPSFVVESAQVLVRVLGTTAFSLDPQDARTRVAVERGRVQIMWWRGATILRAGESAVFPPENESAFGRGEPALGKHPQRVKHAAKHKKSRGAQAVEGRPREPSKSARARGREPAQAALVARAPSARPHGKAAGRNDRRERRAGVAH